MTEKNFDCNEWKFIQNATHRKALLTQYLNIRITPLCLGLKKTNFVTLAGLKSLTTSVEFDKSDICKTICMKIIYIFKLCKDYPFSEIITNLGKETRMNSH